MITTEIPKRGADQISIPSATGGNQGPNPVAPLSWGPLLATEGRVRVADLWGHPTEAPN